MTEQISNEQWSRIDPDLRNILREARSIALDDENYDGFVRPEHLLLALVQKSESVRSVLVHEGVSLPSIIKILEDDISTRKFTSADDEFMDELDHEREHDSGVVLHASVMAIMDDVISRFERFENQGYLARGVDVLVSFYRLNDTAIMLDSLAVELLQDFGITRDTIAYYAGLDSQTLEPRRSIDGLDEDDFINSGYVDTELLDKDFDETEEDDEEEQSMADLNGNADDPGTALVVYEGDNSTEKPKKIKAALVKTEKVGDRIMGATINMCCTDLTSIAKQGGLDNIIGRDEEIERAVQILGRKTKNNPTFLGEPGVGKTAAIEGLAQRIAARRVPERMQDSRLFMLDMNALVAGTGNRGDFEKRMQDLMEDIDWYEQTYGPFLLGVDEVHTLVGAGKVSGSLDASNIIKPKLARGELRMVSATTKDEYKRYIRKDGALDRRFQAVILEEPSLDETLDILRGRQPSFESYHGVEYSDASLKEMVQLASRFMRYRKLPDSAIDLMDECGSKALMDGYTKINVKHVRQATADITKVPYEHLSHDAGKRLKTLGADLNEVIFDQEQAIDVLVRSLKRSRAGVRPQGKTIGSFFFTGPSGNGKTELAKQLATHLGNVPLVQFDMSEYMEKFNVSRLIGSPPGYVGYGTGGQLTEKVRENPYCVLLLDEVEKAHPDVLNVLLQIMEEGHLTDGEGNVIDFSNVTLIMTSNVGANAVKKNAIGFATEATKAQENEEWAGMEELKRNFLGEFLNRVDDIVPFNTIKPETMPKIVMREIVKMEQNLEQANSKPFVIDLDLDSPTVKYLAEKGYDEKNGARPLKRLLERTVGDAIADEILDGSLGKGGLIKVTFNDSVTSKKAPDGVEVPVLDYEFTKVTKTEANQIKAARPSLRAA